MDSELKNVTDEQAKGKSSFACSWRGASLELL